MSSELSKEIHKSPSVPKGHCANKRRGCEAKTGSYFCTDPLQRETYSFWFFSSLSHSHKPFIPSQVQPRKFQLPLDQTSNTSFGVLLRPLDSVKLYRVLSSNLQKKKKNQASFCINKCFNCMTSTRCLQRETFNSDAWH